ncbi:MAG TPA: DUF1501 domain-containing protein [Oligoflexus sp.]|uniref:DUF1501 domain-containing protein n=1 Tax=Oligoflexus sp. TaxID=1971216 RepID=UPI002D8080A9|nr:DUF1501 domain-containing protein [Oligoflexus sp.]HET9240339.1 DUF1501 domain-containing protein [Oligoflexus sp.]
MKHSPMSRRHLLRYSLSTFILSQLGGLKLLTEGEFEERAWAQSRDPHRFLHIFLRGGWDSTLATDPVLGEKRNSGAYESIYLREEIRAVPGKDKLQVGSGLLPALPAFAALPTAFINGLYVDVTAHPLAELYALSGRMSLSRGREYPALAALMGASSANFPSHLVLGGRIPLGETAVMTPPLGSNDMDGMRGMMAEPGLEAGWNVEQTQVLRGMLQDFNKLERLQAAAHRQPQMDSWMRLQASLNGIYDKRLDQGLGADPDRLTRYGVKDSRDNAAMVLGGYQLLRSGLSPYVTVLLKGFDSHNQELTVQKPLQLAFAEALLVLVQDLRQTPDPQRPDLSLADTTTLLIGSEFVRTPKFNDAQGTDHWKSASAILMGKKVRDNTILGQTDAAAHALGWDNQKAVPRTADNALTHEAFAGAVLLGLGFPDAQSTLGKEAVHGLFI